MIEHPAKEASADRPRDERFLTPKAGGRTCPKFGRKKQAFVISPTQKRSDLPISPTPASPSGLKPPRPVKQPIYIQCRTNPAYMIDIMVDRMKGFFLKPVETFKQSGKDDASTVFIYFGALLLFYTVIYTLIQAVFGTGDLTGGAVGIFVGLIMTFVGGYLGMLVFAVWVHLWVYIVGGRSGIMQTVIALFYGSTPSLLLGWIPYVGLIFLIWSLVLYVLGVRELHEISTARAVLAIAIAVIIPLVLIALLAAWLLVSVVSVTPVTV